MKSNARIGRLVIALGLAGLLGGCVNQPSYSGQRVRSARDFEVVETSTKRTLTSREMEHLKAKVADYLEAQGETGDGDYYVKIFLGEETGVEEGEWVVVRYTREPVVRYSAVGSSTGYYDSYYSTYAYDYYPFPYYGFSRLSFQYYDYPYYGYRHYPINRRPHYPGRGHHGNHDGKPGGRPDRDDDRDPPRNDGRPSGALKPSFKPTFVPANVNRGRGTATEPTFDARVAENRWPTRLETRPRERSRDVNPAGPTPPRPAPRTSPDFSTRRPVTTGGATPATPGLFKPSQSRPAGTETSTPRYNRAERQVSPAPSRPSNGRERSYAPATSTPSRPAQEARSNPVTRPAPSAALKPSAPRAQPAPAPARAEPAPTYTAPLERSEPAPASTQRANAYDRGRPERSR